MESRIDYRTTVELNKLLSDNSFPDAQVRELLLEMAQESSSSFAAVTKGAIHWEFLGDWNRAHLLGDLIVDLANIERKRPDLRWEQTVGSTLAATLQSDRNIQTRNEKESEMRRDRAEIAQLVFFRLIEETECLVHFVAPLLGAMKDPEQMEITGGLLDHMDGRGLGAADVETMKSIASVCSGAMGDGKRRAHVEKLLGKIIDEGQSDLVYFVGPLLASLKDESAGDIAARLLSRMDGKRLGAADPETLKRIISIGSATMGDGKRRAQVEKMLGKIIDEGECNLIYFVGPLLASLKDESAGDIAARLLGRMEGKKLGAAEPETLKRIISIGTTAMVHEGQRKHVEKMLGKIIDGGECDLIYFVGPLLASLKDKSAGDIAARLLGRMEGKRLGAADQETLKKINLTGFSAMKDAKERKHVEKMFGKIIDEGECDLIHLVTAMLGGMRHPERRGVIKGLLGRMEGKMLGAADPETVDKIASIAVVALKDAEERPCVEKILAKIIDEGECDLVYFVAPLLKDMRDPGKAEAIGGLLDRMDGKRLGAADPETLKRIISVGSAAMNDMKRQEQVEKLLGTIIDGGECDLVYFVGPLLGATQSPICGKLAEALLARMEGKRLGAADQETMERIISIGGAAMNDGKRRALVEKMLTMIIDEGECDLVYFVAPLLRDMRDPGKAEAIGVLLDRMEGKRLGAADPETLKRIASISNASMRDKKSRIHVEKLLGKIIDEGQSDLVYFVGPLLGATQSPDYGNLAMDLLDRMDGKRLGTPDKETIEFITRIFRPARYGITQSQYVEDFTERLRQEGTKLRLDNSYRGPQWKPQNNGRHSNSNLQQKNRRKN